MPGFVGATRDRGERYGPQYRRDRKRMFAALPDVFTCCRCYQPASKHAKEKPDKRGVIKSAIHLDHDEHGGYRGWACADCNRKAGASKGGRIVAAKYGRWRQRRGAQPPIGLRWRSRDW
jgi:hypothetical protein